MWKTKEKGKGVEMLRTGGRILQLCELQSFPFFCFRAWSACVSDQQQTRQDTRNAETSAVTEYLQQTTVCCFFQQEGDSGSRKEV
jgi:hypothetical protein